MDAVGVGEAPGITEGYGVVALALDAVGVGARASQGYGVPALALDAAVVGATVHSGSGVPALAVDAAGVGAATHHGYGAAGVLLDAAGVGVTTHQGSGAAALALQDAKRFGPGYGVATYASAFAAVGLGLFLGAAPLAVPSVIYALLMNVGALGLILVARWHGR
jgi:hypothetical protein